MDYTYSCIITLQAVVAASERENTVQKPQVRFLDVSCIGVLLLSGCVKQKCIGPQLYSISMHKQS